MSSTGNFIDYLKERRTQLRRQLEEEFGRLHSILEGSGIFTDTSLEYIRHYTAGGKMLRGTLTLLGYEMYGSIASEAVYRAALAIELLQSFLLIHDDIMDKDDTRRGNASAHIHYQKLAEEQRAYRPAHYGVAMAICSGDIAFALAHWLMNDALHSLSLNNDTPTFRQLQMLFSSEVARVGIGQMEDVYYSQHRLEPDPEAVTRLYRNKTGRYTIALPLQVGSYLAGQSANVSALADFGSEVGLIFQLRDDEVSLSPRAISGKPPGSDISNSTRTYARQLLKQMGNIDQLASLSRLERQEHISAADIAQYRELLHRSGVQSHIEELIKRCTSTAEGAIAALSHIDKRYISLLESFLRFNISRKS